MCLAEAACFQGLSASCGISHAERSAFHQNALAVPSHLSQETRLRTLLSPHGSLQWRLWDRYIFCPMSVLLPCPQLREASLVSWVLDDCLEFRHWEAIHLRETCFISTSRGTELLRVKLSSSSWLVNTRDCPSQCLYSPSIAFPY